MLHCKEKQIMGKMLTAIIILSLLGGCTSSKEDHHMIKATYGPMPTAASDARVSAAKTESLTQQAATHDPYLWLEDVDSLRSLKWVRGQNDRTLGVLKKRGELCPIRSASTAD